MTEPLTVERAKELLAEVGLGLAITDGDIDTIATLSCVVARLHDENDLLKSQVLELQKVANRCRDRMVASGKSAGVILAKKKQEIEELRDELGFILEFEMCEHDGDYDEDCRKCRVERLLEG